MNRYILGNVVTSIMATVAVLAVAIGAARNNPDAILVGILTGVYATIVGTSTSAKNELKTEIKGLKNEIKNFHKLSKVD